MGMFRDLRATQRLAKDLSADFDPARQMRDAMSRMGQLTQALQEQSAPIADDLLVPAKAVVLQVASTGSTVNDHPVVALSLLVTVQGGAPVPCTVRLPVALTDLAALRPGSRLDVRVDPARPDRVRLAG
ncbi:hypothetical protein acdb102_13650 [Acidothermaceae bacterium B102]|nr:hypothetical protein acdb102_13650 [Acidothermaceae bacterium B102]